MPKANAMETKIRETCTMHDEAYSFQRFGHLQSALKIQEKPLLPLVLPNVEDHRRVIYSIFEYEPLLGMVPNKKSKVTIFGHKKFVKKFFTKYFHGIHYSILVHKWGWKSVGSHASVWGKTTLITGSVGGAGTGHPTCKMGMILLGPWQ